MSDKVYYNGTWTFENFTVEFTAIGNYWYQPCVMYFADGTGQPEDWDVEDIEVTIKSIKNLETGHTLTSEVEFNYNFSFEKIEDIKEKIADACYEGEYEMNFPEDPYDEPDYEEEEND